MQNTIYRAGLYLRLSKDDDIDGESLSIGTQRAILTDYCNVNQFDIHKIYVDDGFSGMNFARPGSRSCWRTWKAAPSIWSSPKICPVLAATTS